MKREYKFILKSVLINKTSDEVSEISELQTQIMDWCLIGGQLINHRLGGYFFNGLTETQRDKTPKEMREALKLLIASQKNQSLSNIDIIKPLLAELKSEGIQYAGLKGLIFNADMYKLGARRSNDVDIMVPEADLSKLDETLRRMGYIQCFSSSGNLVEASKKEKLIQRMNYHDLVPYVKQVGDFINEIDINFTFDSKENEITQSVLDMGTKEYSCSEYSVFGLPLYTNLAFLCIHFHREGTNTLWTNGHRDITLYKIIDIINTIRAHRDELNPDEWIELMNKLNLQKKCYFTFHILCQFYDDPLVRYIEKKMRPDDISFVDEIFVEGENKIIKRTERFIETAFCLQR